MEEVACSDRFAQSSVCAVHGSEAAEGAKKSGRPSKALSQRHVLQVNSPGPKNTNIANSLDNCVKNAAINSNTAVIPPTCSPH